jgi:hypothetical protein
MGATLALQIVDEPVDLFVRSRPTPLSVRVGDVAVE